MDNKFWSVNTVYIFDGVIHHPDVKTEIRLPWLAFLGPSTAPPSSPPEMDERGEVTTHEQNIQVWQDG